MIQKYINLYYNKCITKCVYGNAIQIAEILLIKRPRYDYLVYSL